MVFQPILPFPLYGTGENQWKMITRPIIPIIFSAPNPIGFNDFVSKGGLGDIELPLLLNPPESMLGHWIFGAGPVFEFPTSTSDSLGAQQYSIGPAVVLGYKTKSFTAALFPNYFFGVGDRSDRKSTTPTTSKLSLLYAFTLKPARCLAGRVQSDHQLQSQGPAGEQVGRPRWALRRKDDQARPHAVQDPGHRGVLRSSARTSSANAPISGSFLSPVIPGLVKKPIFGGK